MKAQVKLKDHEKLDWALNHALMLEHGFVPEIAGALGEPSEMYEHSDPALCLVLIKSHIYQITHTHGGWEVFSDAGNRQFGDTLEQAVARCVIAMKLGEEFEVPDELGVVL